MASAASRSGERVPKTPKFHAESLVIAAAVRNATLCGWHSERIDSCAPAHFDLSVYPSMSLVSPRLHSRAGSRHCQFTKGINLINKLGIVREKNR